VVHEIGDFLPDHLDFIVPARKGTRLSDVRLRIRRLTPEQVVPVNGLPTLTVERTFIDLIEIAPIPRWSSTRCATPHAKARSSRPSAWPPVSAKASDTKPRGRSSPRCSTVPDRGRKRVRLPTTAAITTLVPCPRASAEHRNRCPAHQVGASLCIAMDCWTSWGRHGVTDPEIFGSTARGDDREGSDLDLLVDFAPGTDLIDMVSIKAELEAILGTPVDLIPRDGLKERVRTAAVRDLVPL